MGHFSKLLEIWFCGNRKCENDSTCLLKGKSFSEMLSLEKIGKYIKIL